MDQFSNNDCHLDLDIATLWMEFPDMPTPPPVLPACHGSLCHLPCFPLSTETTIGHLPRIEYCFYPSFDSVYFLDWTGPDILSPSTCADDIFFHLSTFHLLNKVDWADIRLYILSNVTDELVAVYPFFLPRVESMLGNLPRVRKLVQDMITSHDVGELRFRLSVRPRYQEEPDFKGTRTTFDSYIRPVVPLSPRDPYLFA
ncbi:unnamed protein product [Penicillium olsonii]|nr:unnamed protein product [Penicillium olsonii]